MDRNQIELNKFLERDMIEFLDGKINDRDGIFQKTVAQKVEVALQKGNTDLVIATFEELTNKYNTLNKEDAYKSIVYGNILDLFELTKKYMDKVDENSELSEVIKDISESKELKEGELPDRITAFQKVKMERAKRKLAEEETFYKNQAEIEKERQMLSKEIFVNIRKKNLTLAVNNYQRLKEIFKKYPTKFSNEKEEFYNDILSFFLQIKRLRDELQKKYEKFPKKTPVQEADAKKIDAKNIRKIMLNIKEDVEKKDFHSAKSKIIDLKHIASKIQNKNVKGILESKISSINQNIDFIKRKAEQTS